jgi:hypothetical protein
MDTYKKPRPEEQPRITTQTGNFHPRMDANRRELKIRTGDTNFTNLHELPALRSAGIPHSKLHVPRSIGWPQKGTKGAKIGAGVIGKQVPKAWLAARKSNLF